MIALEPTKKQLHVHWLQTGSSEKQLYGNLYEMQSSFTFNFVFYFSIGLECKQGKGVLRDLLAPIHIPITFLNDFPVSSHIILQSSL